MQSTFPVPTQCLTTWLTQKLTKSLLQLHLGTACILDSSQLGFKDSVCASGHSPLGQGGDTHSHAAGPFDIVSCGMLLSQWDLGEMASAVPL